VAWCSDPAGTTRQVITSWGTVDQPPNAQSVS
jgi:hypothetical protein